MFQQAYIQPYEGEDEFRFRDPFVIRSWPSAYIGPLLKVYFWC